MKAPNKNYKVLITEDGTPTLFSKHYNEACHSLSGASNETKLHYLKACEIEKRIGKTCDTQDRVRILEVGFGTGLGFLETYKLFEKHGCLGKLEFISLEIDPELLLYFKKIHGDKYDNNLKVIVGDARQSIKELLDPVSDQRFDAIYQDAFSPRRNPKLWTTQWFRDLMKLSYEETILSTYSASTRIRKSLIKAGWVLYPGEKFGTKRSSTIAKTIGRTHHEILDKLKRSPVEALDDLDIESYRKLD